MLPPSTSPRPGRALAARLAALALACATAAPVAAAAATPPQDADRSAPDDDVERATEWPKPESKDALADALIDLRRSESEDEVERSTEALAGHGAAAAPRLLRALGRAKSDEEAARFVRVLEMITAPEHTRLLAESFDDRADAVRLFALRRVAELGDPGLRERAEAIHAKAAAAAAKAEEERKRRKQKEVDPAVTLEHRRAAILALSTGSAAPVDDAVAVAGSTAWSEWRPALEAATRLGAAANDGLADAFAALLEPSADARVRVGAVRLLTHAGTRDHAPRVAALLDARENHVKVAAINALRVLVDGDEPLETISTFDAIEMAQKWKQRIR